MNAIRSLVYWLSMLVFYMLAILAVGTGVFVLGFLFFGLMFSSLSLEELVRNGAWVGFRYSGVWTTGLSIILCIITWKKQREKAQAC